MVTRYVVNVAKYVTSYVVNINDNLTKTTTICASLGYNVAYVEAFALFSAKKSVFALAFYVIIW